jgi:hypothetical protein
MTKEEILNNEIKDEPFYLSENLEPYIYKAMEIYAKQYHESLVALGLPSVIKRCYFNGCNENVVTKSTTGKNSCLEHWD